MSDQPNEYSMADLVSGKPKALQIFFDQHAPALYTFCVKMCLGDMPLAKKLFLKALNTAKKKMPASQGAIDIWFYSALHQVWPNFVRLRRALKDQMQQNKFDWKYGIGSPHDQCLAIVTPAEREIVLHRILNRYPLGIIKKIFSGDYIQAEALFLSAISKITKL